MLQPVKNIWWKQFNTDSKMMNRLVFLLGLVITIKYTCGNPVKRCANLFSEDCINEGVIGGGRDEEWIGSGNTPGRRSAPLKHAPKYYRGNDCPNMFDEGCINEGIIGGGRDEEWITDPESTPGKRNAIHKKQAERERILQSLGELVHRVQSVVTKRCANLFDEGCINGGLPGSGDDEDWLNNGGTPGRR